MVLCNRSFTCTKNSHGILFNFINVLFVLASLTLYLDRFDRLMRFVQKVRPITNQIALFSVLTNLVYKIIHVLVHIFQH